MPERIPQDVELVAATLYETEFNRPWSSAGGRWHSIYRHKAEAVLAALAEAGRLLPADAAEEWSIRYTSDGYVLDRNFTEAGARQWVATEPDAAFELVHRRVGPWQPVKETPAEPSEANMLADGTICQPGQRHACGDYHNAGQCVRPRDTEETADAPVPPMVGAIDDAIAAGASAPWAPGEREEMLARYADDPKEIRGAH